MLGVFLGCWGWSGLGGEDGSEGEVEEVVVADEESDVMRDESDCFRRSAAIFKPISTSFFDLSRAGRGCLRCTLETLAWKKIVVTEKALDFSSLPREVEMGAQPFEQRKKDR